MGIRRATIHFEGMGYPNIYLPAAANPRAIPTKPPVRPPKVFSITVRLNSEGYVRLNAHAGRLMPRCSFQAILMEALDAYGAGQARGQ